MRLKQVILPTACCHMFVFECFLLSIDQHVLAAKYNFLFDLCYTHCPNFSRFCLVLSLSSMQKNKGSVLSEKVKTVS